MAEKMNEGNENIQKVVPKGDKRLHLTDSQNNSPNAKKRKGKEVILNSQLNQLIKETPSPTNGMR